MLAFSNLSDKDIDDILEYTTNPPAPEPAADAATASDTNSVAALEMAQNNPRIQKLF